MTPITTYEEQRKTFVNYWKMLAVGAAIGLPLTLYLKPRFRDQAWITASALTLVGFTIKTIMLSDK